MRPRRWEFGGKSLTSAGGSDIFLAKYECNGQLLWVLQAGGSGDDAANDLAFDAGANIYVTGWFVGPASFESLGGQPRTVSGSDETVFVAFGCVPAPLGSSPSTAVMRLRLIRMHMFYTLQECRRAKPFSPLLAGQPIPFQAPEAGTCFW